jgi:DNA-binding transcriptional ArsR family regulator
VDPLSATFFALSDPTRRAILTRLVAGEATVGELAEPFSISLPAISRHLRVLEQSRLIERRAEAQRRLCRLRVETLEDASQWLELHRQFWQEGLDKLAELLEQPTPSTPKRPPTARRKTSKRAGPRASTTRRTR